MIAYIIIAFVVVVGLLMFRPIAGICAFWYAQEGKSYLHERKGGISIPNETDWGWGYVSAFFNVFLWPAVFSIILVWHLAKLIALPTRNVKVGAEKRAHKIQEKERFARLERQLLREKGEAE